MTKQTIQQQLFNGGIQYFDLAPRSGRITRPDRHVYHAEIVTFDGADGVTREHRDFSTYRAAASWVRGVVFGNQ